MGLVSVGCATELPDCEVEVWFPDADRDGFGANAPALGCLPAPNARSAPGDCDDADPSAFPGAEEVAGDGVDQDCDGVDAAACFLDADADGAGGPTPLTASDGDCDDPRESTTSDDCDDLDPGRRPGAEEVVGDGIDQDCDGFDAVDCFADVDGDGWGAEPRVSPGGDCRPEGLADAGGDCDDAEAATFPGNPEVCDGLDNDCDPSTDELADGDVDGFTLCDGDCDDAEPRAGPTGPEVCDGVDNDCDGPDDERRVPGDYERIQAAIDGAVDGDLVCVGAGTWAGALDLLGKDLALVGEGSGGTIVIPDVGAAVGLDADVADVVGMAFVGFDLGIRAQADATLQDVLVDGAGVAGDRGLVVLSGDVVLTDVTLRGHAGGADLRALSGFAAVGLSITDNHGALEGGGLRIEGAVPGGLDLSGAALHANSAVDGGGLFWVGSQGGTLAGGSFTSNTAVSWGGGVRLPDPTAVADVVLHDNTALAGGGLSGTVTAIVDSTVTDNHAPGGSGGGLYLQPAGVVAVSGCVIEDNDAGAGGGVGLWGPGPGGEVFDFTGTIIENNAAGLGGGIHSGIQDVTLRGAVVVSNSAGDGGGVEIHSSAVLEDCTIDGNTASDDGGGVSVFGSAALTLVNVVVTGNTAADDGGGVHLSSGPLVATAGGFSWNTAGGVGGGAAVGAATLTDCSFFHNQAAHGGGMIGGDVTVVGGSFSHNDAVALGGQGGGLSAGPATITGVSFTSNEASYGGGVHTTGATVGDCTFDSNSAWFGGGLHAPAGDITITHSAFVGCTAMFPGSGGGAHVEFDAVIENSIFDGAPIGPFGAAGGSPALVVEGGPTTLRYLTIVGTLRTAWLDGADTLEGIAVEGWGATPAIEVTSGALPLSYSRLQSTGTVVAGAPDPTGTDGNTAGSLGLQGGTWSSVLLRNHLSATSASIDLGPPGDLDPDGSPADVGAFGGPDAGAWDLDGDGFPGWWQPGPYDTATYPAGAWDCDDQSPVVYPGAPQPAGYDTDCDGI